ncbi:MAG: hypothetical protein ACK55I_23475, partial [bacterium]
TSHRSGGAGDVHAQPVACSELQICGGGGQRGRLAGVVRCLEVHRGGQQRITVAAGGLGALQPFNLQGHITSTGKCIPYVLGYSSTIIVSCVNDFLRGNRCT